MSSKQDRFKVELPEDLRKTAVVNFKASPRVLGQVAEYARKHEITMADACRRALEKLVESTSVTSK
jgi:hypothetical protein